LHTGALSRRTRPRPPDRAALLQIRD
jgi:hypothetical protein